ncbi:MAG TPA: hypothetical protein VIJ34_09195 [Acidimicrobiales bacterium]
MASRNRYSISYGALGSLLTLLGLGRGFSFIERNGERLHLKMGWGFRARFP